MRGTICELVKYIIPLDVSKRYRSDFIQFPVLYRCIHINKHPTSKGKSKQTRLVFLCIELSKRLLGMVIYTRQLYSSHASAPGVFNRYDPRRDVFDASPVKCVLARKQSLDRAKRKRDEPIQRTTTRSGKYKFLWKVKSSRLQRVRNSSKLDSLYGGYRNSLIRETYQTSKPDGMLCYSVVLLFPTFPVLANFGGSLIPGIEAGGMDR